MKGTTDENRAQRTLYWRHRSGSRLILPNYTPHRWYECDLFVVLASGFTIEYEIKRTVSDFRADRRKTRKHQRLRDRDRNDFLPTRFFYVVPEGLIDDRDVPDYAGLMHLPRMSDDRPVWNERIVRQAPRLSTTRVPERIMNHGRATACFRFWHERFAFEDFRETNDLR